MKPNIVSVQWFSGRDTVGVVLVETKVAGYKAYIGPALDISEEKDAEYIAKWGAKITAQHARAIFGPKLIGVGTKYDGVTQNRI